MLVERSMHPQFLSNTYLVAAGPSGERRPAVFIDAGGPVEGLIEFAERYDLQPTHVLVTHHHFDHVSETATLLARWPDLQVLLDPVERELLADGVSTGTVEAGDTLTVGALEIKPLHTPGHTAGMLSFLVTDTGPAYSDGVALDDGHAAAAVFTGDTLFRDSVGGLHAPGHTSYQDLKDSIMGTLMELSGDTVVYPGHTDSTTVAREWERNPFIRTWRRLDREGSRPCVALGQPATLVLLAPDYDGGHKAWVRWPGGADDIVPGSRVELRA
jgi:glyoxylase-like metal-dependent hydrolase (beta-lactamase superfamily II)